MRLAQVRIYVPALRSVATPVVIRGKAGARPVQGRCRAGQGAALNRDSLGLGPGLVQIKRETRLLPRSLVR